MIRTVEERLQKVLARAGFASRRGAEALMQDGRVTVNGEIVRELGTKADPAQDDIRVDGVRVKAARELVYIVLNKPRGVVTTRRDPSGRPTVMDLVPGVPGLFPVGRLDLTTEGLILLTNDGAFAERVAHPRFEVPRVYHAKVRGVPDAKTLARLRRGVRVKDELMVVDRARVIDVDRNAWVEVALHEGKQHEVRRLLEAVGHPVSKLRRVSFGPVTLRSLGPGEHRVLEPGEVAGLLRGDESPATPARHPRRRRPPTAREAGVRQTPAGKTGARGPGVGRARARKAGTKRAAARKTDAGRAGAQKLDTRETTGRKTAARRAGRGGSAGSGRARPPARRRGSAGSKRGPRERIGALDRRRRR
jgi:pseudouridine synthase